jgi:DNA-binding CsgD family transcriptional regulator
VENIMIRLGRSAIDRDGIADMAGKNVRTLSNKKVFDVLDVVRGGMGAKVLYDLEQAQVLVANLGLKKGQEPAPIPAIPDPTGYTEHELRGYIIDALQEEKGDGFVHDITVEELDEMDEDALREYIDGHDLLDLEEARMAIPADRRPTEKTMYNYYYGNKGTTLPEADRTICGKDHWFRSTIDDWNRNGRLARGQVKTVAGRKPGSTGGWTPRSERNLAAAERRRQTLALREQDPSMPISQIADTLGISERQASYYLSATTEPSRPTEERAQRMKQAAQEYKANPETTGPQLAEKLGISETTARVYLAALRRTAELLAANSEITDKEIAEELGILQETVTQYRADLAE